MCALAVAPREAPLKSAPARVGGSAPLYIVCSPSRRVGKTLVARFITEYYLADGRPVVAYDLADETPQLADFLPGHTGVTDISDIRGQMALFDGLIADNDVPKVIDVGHRMFGLFFATVHKIGLFDEARLRGIEPVILFMIDPDPKAEKAYSLLRRSFPGISLLPARNLAVAKGLRYGDTFPHASTLAASLEISQLPPSLQSLIDRTGLFVRRFSAAPAPGRSPLRQGARRTHELDQAAPLPAARNRALSHLRADSLSVAVREIPGGPSQSPAPLSRPAGLVAFDLRYVACDPALRFEHIESVLQTKEIALGETEELAQAKIGVRRDIARAVDDRVDAISRHTD